ncbi:helix-turn-helix transcriptional regulator [Aneurinibacillus aneurinilyticus]|uniref:helix-turn-helix domain-containing protein n=1 Tax=Aneurinibacillus aneurinilyticus TaxID=1391 RepID=UPI002E23C912|nr:helix-turn-helix transcriptional regulator [Aneurinibacillus aneurinilyticus]
MSSIGERVKRLREKKGWTQRDFAKKLGISNSVLSRVENGEKKNVEDYLIKRLAETLDTSSDYLLDLSNNAINKENSPSKESEKEMSLFFYDGIEGYDDLSPEEQKAFREHMYDEARQTIELVKKLKKQGKRGGMYER